MNYGRKELKNTRMTDNDIVITGISAIASPGAEMNEIFTGLINKESNFSALKFQSDTFSSRKAAYVKNFRPQNIISDNKIIRFMSEETKFGVCALILCIEDSGVIVNETYQDGDIALYAGTGSSGIEFDYIENLLDNSSNDITGQFDPVKFGEIGLQRLNPLTSFKILPNMPPSVAAIVSGIKGGNLIFNPWEGSALLALNEAYYEIKSGREKIVYCGGSDCKTHSDAFIAFTEYGLLDNNDTVLSEGSSYICLEDYESAGKRGAKIYCKIRGVTNLSYISSRSCDYAYSKELYANIINNSLDKCDLCPEEIDLIIDSNDLNQRNDEMENMAIQDIFANPLVLSPKKIIGNAFAASGFISVSIAAYILKENIKIDNRIIQRILINSFAPGSEKFCIILEKI